MLEAAMPVVCAADLPVVLPSQNGLGEALSLPYGENVDEHCSYQTSSATQHLDVEIGRPGAVIGQLARSFRKELKTCKRADCLQQLLLACGSA